VISWLVMPLGWELGSTWDTVSSHRRSFLLRCVVTVILLCRTTIRYIIVIMVTCLIFLHP
jgi:hypothetical protein